jgi:hypothetical protein
MQRLEVSGAVRPIYGSLGDKRLTEFYAVVKTAFFWAITKRVVLISYRRVGSTYRSLFVFAPEVGTNRLSQNISNVLPLYGA